MNFLNTSFNMSLGECFALALGILIPVCLMAYLWSREIKLTDEDRNKMSAKYSLGWKAFLIVSGLILLGFFIAGLPVMRHLSQLPSDLIFRPEDKLLPSPVPGIDFKVEKDELTLVKAPPAGQMW